MFLALPDVSLVSEDISSILFIRVCIRPLELFSVSLIIFLKFEDKLSNLVSSNPDIEDIAENNSDIAVTVVLFFSLS